MVEHSTLAGSRCVSCNRSETAGVKRQAYPLFARSSHRVLARGRWLAANGQGREVIASAARTRVAGQPVERCGRGAGLLLGSYASRSTSWVPTRRQMTWGVPARTSSPYAKVARPLVAKLISQTS